MRSSLQSDKKKKPECHVRTSDLIAVIRSEVVVPVFIASIDLARANTGRKINAIYLNAINDGKSKSGALDDLHVLTTLLKQIKSILNITSVNY